VLQRAFSLAGYLLCAAFRRKVDRQVGACRLPWWSVTQAPSTRSPRTGVASSSSGPSGLSFAIIGSRGYPSTYGGYETLVRYLARYLVADGHHVTVYCREPNNGRRVWHVDGVRCVATRGKDSKQLSTLSFGATSIADASLRRFDAALVLNIANGYWMPMLRAARVPFAVNTDGLEWQRAKWSKLGKTVFRVGAELSARFAPELVCDSQALGNIWQDEFGRSSVFIPYGGEVRASLGDTRIRDLGLATRSYVLSVARLAPENNVELTLDAIERLGEAAPKAVIVGSANFDNPITTRLKALQEQGKVLWLGHVADQDLLAELWQNAGVYVHGHSVGGTNPALLQALGAGAPTIALDTVFNREVLPFDQHLYPHDAAALAARIDTIISTDATQRDLIATGSDAVTGRYSWDDVCRKYTDLMVELAAARRR
jgi:glycosyltransferase involved in cell wall biosynthesis